MTPAWLAPILPKLLSVNLAAGLGILLVLMLRRPVLNAFGARAAYGLWLVPLLAGLAVLLPARLAPAPAPLEGVLILAPVAASPPAAGDLPGFHIIPDLAPWFWLAGALIGLAWLAMSHGRFLAAERAGRAGPAVAGLLRPRIVLPADFTQRFEPGERAAILAHERAHLQGQHSRINALASFLACLSWFNPLIHVAVRRLRLDQDLACDEAALARHPGQARLYAATLLKAQMQGQGSPLACAFGAHPLAERVALAARRRPGSTRRLAGLCLVVCLGLGGAAAAWAAQPARPAALKLAAPLAPDRASPADAPTPREGPAITVASRTPAARQLLAEAVPSTPEGETMIPTSPAPRRLAAAAVLALGLGTSSAQAAAPPPPPAPVVAPVPPAPPARVASPAPVVAPRPVPTPREIPPRPASPPLPPRPRPVIGASGPAVAELVLADGTHINCSTDNGRCAEAFANAMKASAKADAAGAKASALAEAAAAKARADAGRVENQARLQALKGLDKLGNDEAANAEFQSFKAQLDALAAAAAANPALTRGP